MVVCPKCRLAVSFCDACGEMGVEESLLRPAPAEADILEYCPCCGEGPGRCYYTGTEQDYWAGR